MVSEQSRSLETPPQELSGQILLACNILVDGREPEASYPERLARASEEVRRQLPVPPGTSALAMAGPEE